MHARTGEQQRTRAHTFNNGNNNAASCDFFLPAGEVMGCKIQFGSVNISSARWIPLHTKMFTSSNARSISTVGVGVGDGGGGSGSAGQVEPSRPAASHAVYRHWDRLVGYDMRRGPQGFAFLWLLVPLPTVL